MTAPALPTTDPTTDPATDPTTGWSRASSRGVLRRTTALAGAELRLLVRNRTALLYALTLPLACVLLIRSSGLLDDAGLAGGAMIVACTAGATLIFAVYYNLVTAFVARREDRVLKRLRTGELTDAEILAGTAAPSVAVAVGQIVVATAAAAATIGLAAPANPVLLPVALVAGIWVFVLLAIASTVFTRNVETAQITTMPVVVLPLFLSGMFTPLTDMPTGLRVVAEAMPLTPVVDLMRLGFTGTDRTGEALGTAETFVAAGAPVAVAAAWVVLLTVAYRRWFRWEPRR